jgi:hypothetical protein
VVDLHLHAARRHRHPERARTDLHLGGVTVLDGVGGARFRADAALPTESMLDRAHPIRCFDLFGTTHLLPLPDTTAS